MRRFLLALLVPLGTVVTPGANAAGADTTVNAHLNLRHLHSHLISSRVQLANQATTAVAHLAEGMHLTLAQLRAQWQHVAWCEVHGNWAMQGPSYSGIGFANGSWNAYGGRTYAPNAGLATMDEQILIGMAITGGSVPDQWGCNPYGW